jgi:hypothetical protein
MNDRENNACQYALHRIEILKYTPLVQMIQVFVTSFPIALDEYPILSRFHGHVMDSHGRGGIKETYAGPRLGDRARNI